MENLSFFEKHNHQIQSSITIKLIVTGVLFLIMLIPVSMVKSLIHERESRREKTIQEVSSKWGESQTITGPVLSIPYKSYYKDKNDKVIETISYSHFLPNELNIEGKINPEIRYRGIYEVIVYKSDLIFKGSFLSPDFVDWNVNDKDIMWKDTFISIGIPDMRGIEDYIELKCNNEVFPLNPGIETKDVIESGISARYPIKNKSNAIKFSFNMKLNGSKLMYFVPLGRETKVKLSSDWNTPSFDGAFLPDTRDVSDKGFTADWKVLHLNRNYPQKWLGSSFNVISSAFGVKLLIPVDQYQKSMRTAKYASMFISLTFLIFFFVEILNKKRIHPVQYILVGLALCIFFTLLLSISEHISFDLSYIISSLAVVLLISGYSKSIFKNNPLTVLMAGVLIILYGFIYTILQLEDYALLLGSIGLFIVITIVMYLSRKIDWYALESDKC